MKKEVLIGASYRKKNCYTNAAFQKLPDVVQQQCRQIVVSYVEEFHGVFLIGFYENGELFLHTQADEEDWDYDEIGAKLAIGRLNKEHKELFQELILWFNIHQSRGNNGIAPDIENV